MGKEFNWRRTFWRWLVMPQVVLILLVVAVAKGPYTLLDRITGAAEGIVVLAGVMVAFYVFAWIGRTILWGRDN